MNNIDNLIENLNKEQKEAVLNTEGPNLIVAGAGSGKTRVLTTRLIHIINLVVNTLVFPDKINTYYKSKKSLAKSNFMCDFYK